MLAHLAILLLAPWLLILGWAYWRLTGVRRRAASGRTFDVLALLAAAGASVAAAELAYAAVPPAPVDGFGRASGAIWQQVLPALLGYGACVAVLASAWLLRSAWSRRSATGRAP